MYQVVFDILLIISALHKTCSCLPLYGCERYKHSPDGPDMLTDCNKGGITKCVRDNILCDGRIDCVGGSDELNCTSNHNNQKGMFACMDGEYISDSYVCDGLFHCQNGTDEFHCRPCPHGMVACPTHPSKCIKSSRVCDGRGHCDNDSDELNCYKCLISRKVIKSNMVCDGINDCWTWLIPHDISDETNCTVCKNLKCSNGNQCLHPDKQCDGYYDCSDHSDEICEICPESRPFKCISKGSYPIKCMTAKNFNKRTCPLSSKESICEAISLSFQTNISDLFTCDGGHCVPPDIACSRLHDSGHNPYCEDPNYKQICYNTPCSSRY